jgi:hypothetical protein
MATTVVSPTQDASDAVGQDAIAARKRLMRETLRCPHCDRILTKWKVPESPFNEWPSEFQFICFNDACDYFVRGWATMAAQRNFGSYRFMYDPSTSGCYAVTVLSPKSLRDGIVTGG